MLLEIVGKILSIENEIIIVASVMAAKDVLDYCVVAGVPARIIKKKSCSVCVSCIFLCLFV